MPATPQRTDESIFAEALAIPSSEERAAFLDRVCGTDPAGRERIEILLRSHDEAGNFMQKPLVAPCAALAPPVLVESPGTVIGRYKLLQQIGEGGFGIVYMAEQKEPIRRRVALKIIKLGMDTREVIARFEAERQALALMDHPNIARVLDAGATQAGRPYFVMELVHGVSIAEFCDRNRLPARERLQLFVAVCQAVQHAHQKGVLHRDLKPSNILVTLHDGKPVPKVIDFGVAKALNQELTEKTLFTAFGHMVGTPQYMSPEQAEMSGLDVDTRSDIYSLGVVLYELLTGTTPLEAKQLRQAAFVEMQRLIREEEAPRPSQRLSTLGERLSVVAKDRQCEPTQLQRLLRGELDWIVLKALEKDRTRRYETANSLARDLQHYLADEPVEACPPTVGYRVRKFARKNKKLLATAVAFAALLLLGVAGSLWQAVRATQAEARANDNEQRANDSAAKARENEQEAIQKREEAQTLAGKLKTSLEQLRRTTYIAEFNLAVNAWDDARVPAAIHLLKKQIPKPGEKDLRSFEWYYLDHLCRSQALLNLRVKGNITEMAYSSDGKQLIIVRGGTYMSGQGKEKKIRDYPEVQIQHAETGKEIKAFKLTGAGNTVFLSPDATRVAGADALHTRVWDVQTGTLIKALPSGASGIPVYGRVVFSEDGEILATLPGSDVKLWGVQDGKLLGMLKDDSNFSTGAFSPDGKIFATAGTRIEKKDNKEFFDIDSELKLWNVKSAQEIRHLKGHVGQIRQLIFSPNGKRLAVMVWKGDVFLWDTETGKLLDPLREPSGGFTAVSFSLDSSRIAAAGGAPGTPCINVWDAHSGHLTAVFHGHTGQNITQLRFTPDSLHVVSGSDDQTLRLWDLEKNLEVRTLKGHTQRISGIAISPDGTRLASGTSFNFGEVKIWDLVKREKKVTLEGSQSFGRTTSAVFSRDLRHIAGMSGPKLLKVWDAQTGKPLFTLEGHTRFVTCVAFSWDAKYVASGDGQAFSFPGATTTEPGVVKVWNAATGKLIFSCAERNSGVLNVTFSQDRKLLAAAYRDGTIRVYDTLKGEEISAFQGNVAVWQIGVAFSPDGKHLAGGGKVWDIETGKEIFSDIADGLGFVFSPDGKRLASRGGKVMSFDGKTVQTLSILPAQDNKMFQSIAFSPDGKRLATATSRHMKIWDVESGQELLSLKVNLGPGASIAFADDGYRLGCVTPGDGTVTIWDGTPLPETPE
jgi:WD40 repeat protein/serine/threonine protein kinase